MAARVAPGGQSTLTLGSEDPGSAFRERHEQRSASVATPDALPRFPHAPGGASSVCLGSPDGTAAATAATTRGPVGGEATVCFGAEDVDEILRERQQQRRAAVQTPAAAPRFPQAPGGCSSIVLGAGEGAPACAAPRGPVGGASSISLGDEPLKATFDERARLQQRGAELAATPEALHRFPQAPGGESSVCFGAAPECPSSAPRGPVGGKCSITFGAADDDAGAAHVAVRGPVGGEATISLGSDSTRSVFEEHRRMREAEMPTPDAKARFPQAPGGDSSIALGGSVGAGPPVPTRGPVGGPTSICLEDDGNAGPVAVATSRGPVGGEASVVLGVDSSAEMWRQRQQLREAPVETPAAAPRFPQAPGGHSSVVLGDGQAQELVAARGPVGGATTITFGEYDVGELMLQRQQARQQHVDTPDAAQRFPQAPGGTSSLAFHHNGLPLEPLPAASPTKGPVGGASTVVLGSEDPALAFSQVRRQLEAEFSTPDAAPRFPQAPGGSSTIALGGGDGPAGEGDGAAVGVGRPIGGAATVVLGTGDYPRDTFQQLAADRERAFDTPSAVPRFVPGGQASTVFGSEPGANQTPVRGPVGGAATVLLGSDDTAADFQARQAQRDAAVSTPDARPRFPQAPGGASTVVLGVDAAVLLGEMHTSRAVRTAPGGTSTMTLGGNYPDDILGEASSNSFANGARQNSGNVLTNRPTIRLNRPPGGATTICLGEAEPSAPAAAAAAAADAACSSNRFACGSSQNAGNVITERPTTRLHQAPGGTSTLVLGGDYPDDRLQAGASQPPSSNAFASGAHQNCGNSITGRSTTRRLQAPGGTSTICLGDGLEPAKRNAGGEGGSKVDVAKAADENLNTSNVLQPEALEKEKDAFITPPRAACDRGGA